MPPSQLKRLKTSLRERGITGPQRSKKVKKSQQGEDTRDKAQRNADLQQIRDSFNPFEFKANARPEKFVSFSTKSVRSNGSSGGFNGEVRHRPGVSKSVGEEMRRDTLLQEVRNRNKVGRLVDRRIGEGDINLTPEERAVQRFAREKERKKKSSSLFNLEESDDDELKNGTGLTHLGKSIDDYDLNEGVPDDAASADSDVNDGELFLRKRRHSEISMEEERDIAGEGAEDDQPERKRSKKEILQEVIAKSKLHKYERQKAKEDDEDIREKLDQGMGDVLSLLQGMERVKPPAKTREPENDRDEPAVNPDRQKLIDGRDRSQVDKDYDVRLKQLAADARAKPSERTKTAEEKAVEAAEKLRNLEEKRLKRMHGEAVPDQDHENNEDFEDRTEGNEDDDIADEAAEFGFTNSSLPSKNEKHQIVLDDEDEFLLDEDLVAGASDIDPSELESVSTNDEVSDMDEGMGSQHHHHHPANEDDEFIRDILGDDILAASAAPQTNGSKNKANGSEVAYTYPCPRTHQELLDVLKDISTDGLTTVIQRIRALYHPSLSASNKEAMADFSCTLVDHIAHMGVEKQSLSVIEQVIRHLHSLSRTYPTEIGERFRKHLLSLHEQRQPNSGDVVILTAIGSIYPTSDQWHQVVTPASTFMARWLSLNAPLRGKPMEAKTSSIGACLVALGIQYQTLSQRYIPEALRFTLHILASKSTNPQTRAVHIENLLSMAELWKDKPAFIETVLPAISILQKLSITTTNNNKKELHTLTILLQQARLRRRPLELHHHRPLPIRTAIPKFEESFHPDKHYDPDKDRSDAKKLQKEYKRERKGALRDLRKDANFMAREQLREKRARDAEYEKKYRRLVAEVQAEEGHEKKNYEREKRLRKGKK